MRQEESKKISIFTALSIILAMLSFGIMIPNSAKAETTEISSGYVTWGIKESWRQYIGASGTELSGGVELLSSGEYKWPISSGYFDNDTSTLTLNLEGSIRYTSYPLADGSYALDSTFSDLRVEISPEKQVVFLYYGGIDRDTGELVGAEVEYASLDVTNAGFESDGLTTSWSKISTYATKNSILYADGTPHDPLSIEYLGAGGIPDLGEVFQSKNSPVLRPGSIWDSGTADESSRTIFASEKNDLVYIVDRQSSSGDLAHGFVIVVLNSLDMTEVAQYFLPARAKRFDQVAFDPVSDTLFFADADSVLADFEYVPVNSKIHALVFDQDSGAFALETITEISFREDIVSPSINGLYWDRINQTLVVIVNHRDTTNLLDIGEIHFIDSVESEWLMETEQLIIPADSIPGTPNRLYSVLGDGIEFSKLIAATGSSEYVLAIGGTYRLAGASTRYSFPLAQLRRTDAALEVSFIEDTQTPDSGFTALEDNGAGQLILYGADDMNALQYVDYSEGSPKARGDSFSIEEVSSAIRKVASDPEHSIDYFFSHSTQIASFVGGELSSVFQLADVNRGGISHYPMIVGRDGSLFLVVKNSSSGTIGIQRFILHGVTPQVVDQPVSQVVDLGVGTSQDVVFTAQSEGGTGEWVQQWQVKKPGESRFTDIAGETGNTLIVTATDTDNGNIYRSTFTNDIGAVVSDEATLTVNYAPRVVTNPATQDGVEKTTAVFQAAFNANPDFNDVYWEYRNTNGFWTRIATDNNFTVTTAEGLTSLTVNTTAVDQTGTRFRAVASNPSGTVTTREAILTVRPAVEIPDDGLNLDDVTLRWAISNEVQAKPPFGTSNYLSAGTSDGSEASYTASEGEVAIIHTDGVTSTEPTYNTRDAHVTTSGLTQLVELGGGDAEITDGGATTISWEGAFSINFYDGLVPFTITNPKLEVSAAGTGVLTADLSGYAVEMSNPEDKTPLTGDYTDTTIATFTGVTIDPQGVVTVTPDYDGVIIDVPVGVTPQVTEGAGWGSWPQPFVDFHFDTNLSSYWYSSGGVGDVKKPPLGFEVDFTTASTDPEPSTPSEDDLNDTNKGEVTIPSTATAGGQLVIGGLTAGEQIDVVLFPDTYSFDRVTVGADGTITVTMPTGRTGDSTVAVYSPEGTVIGWGTTTITDDVTPPPSGSSPSSLWQLISSFIAKILAGLSALFGAVLGSTSSS